MAKTKLTAQQQIEKHLKAIKKIKENEKKKLAQVPLDFTKKLEKIWNKSLTEKEFTAILDLIKQNKTAFDKCITTSTSTSATASNNSTNSTAKPTQNTTASSPYKKP